MLYHKINGIFKRNHETNRFIIGDYSIPEFDLLKSIEWEFVEKLDGTNVHVEFDGQNRKIGGRTERTIHPKHLLFKLESIFSVEKLQDVFNENPDNKITLFGEGVGAKIQNCGGNYNPDGADFVLFDVNVGGWWLKKDVVAEIAKKLGVRSAPIVGYGTLQDGIDLVKNGLTSEWGDFEAEGIIARPKCELFARNGKRIITKIKIKDFR